MARDSIAEHVIFKICGGVTKFAEATKKNKHSVRNYLNRGFPGNSSMNEIYQSLRESGCQIGPEDFFEASAVEASDATEAQ